jgi:gas vesicle protein
MREEENYRREGLSTSEKLTFLVIGGGIGAIVALLFAPKPGSELRDDIADVTRKGLEKGRETATQIGERAGEYYEVAREQAGEYYETTKERASDLYGTASEKVRGAAQRPANSLSAAIDAGKKAYFDEKRRTESASIAEGRPSYPSELGEGAKENES